MKKLLIELAVLTLILGSCQKENLESPGNIKGMGNASGYLEVKAPFILPQGIRFIGEITGLTNPVSKGGFLKSASDVKAAYSCFGSGGKMIKLKLTLLNSGNVPKTVFFPKGLLWECTISGYQHAILLQTTWICLQANSQRAIVMDLYCINLGLSPADQNSTYHILGVTSSNVIGNLLKMIGWKKINYEMIFGTFASVKGTTIEPTYDQITDRMQNIVWNLTNNGKDVSAEDKTFIESIPELNSAEIPVLDEKSQFPEYFKEFVVPEK